MSIVRVLSTSRRRSRGWCAGGDELDHLELAAGKPTRDHARPRPVARVALDRLAELDDLLGGLGRQGRRTELRARSRRCLSGPVPRRAAGGCECDAGAELDLRPLEGDGERLVQFDRAVELLRGDSGWPSASAVSPSACASAARTSGWPVAAAISTGPRGAARASANAPWRAKKQEAHRSPQTA